MTFTHGYADNNGLRMYYEVHGRAVPGQPPLLLIPGGGSTIGTNFSELIPLLAEQSQVIAVEEEGHGRTQPTSRPLTAENSAGDILAVLNRLNVETVDVLGFSAGGHTAIALALAAPRSCPSPHRSVYLREPRCRAGRVLGRHGEGHPR